MNLLTLVPPPSSDKRKWWLDNNASSKVEIPKPPGDGWQLNPNRPKNPFDNTDEPDWIKVTAPQIPFSAPIDQKKIAPVPPPRRQQTEPVSPQEPQLLRRSSSLSSTGKSKPPVPPKPSFISARASVTSSPSPSEDGDFKPAPPLPPPRPQETAPKHVQKDGKVGLLMDDDDEGEVRVVGGWVPLQPSKEL
jgi:synaptojanin